MTAPLPAWQHRNATIYQGSADAVFAALPAESVHAVCCSPPYWGLRSYGTNPQVWDADSPDCPHDWQERRRYVEGGSGERSAEAFSEPGEANAARLKAARWKSDATCARCGAWRGELGREPTPALYVRHIVGILRAVRRALRDDGTLWLNVGDSYASSPGKGDNVPQTKWQAHGYPTGASHRNGESGIPAKNLCLIPERLSIALQEDGWIVRQVIIWDKPACMPESVTDRCTTSHEYVYMLAKNARYYFDQEAIREPTVEPFGGYQEGYAPSIKDHHLIPQSAIREGKGRMGNHPSGRNSRTVWRIPPDPQGAMRLDDGETISHFASFPIGLPTRCILAGTSERGCCSACGKPWVRVVERELRPSPGGGGKRADTPGAVVSATSVFRTKMAAVGGTTGWQPSCACDAPVAPCVVADPFTGSGTTALAALKLGRAFVGAELNPDYIKLASQRIRGAASQTTLFDAGAEATA